MKQKMILAMSLCLSLISLNVDGFSYSIDKFEQLTQCKPSRILYRERTFGMALKYTDNKSFHNCRNQKNNKSQKFCSSIGYRNQKHCFTRLQMASNPYANGPSDDDSSGDEEGLNLAAEFFANLKGRGMDAASLNSGMEDEDDDDDDDDEENRNISISEVNAFTGFDQGKVGKLAGNVTFTNKELYSTLKERILESPAAFTNLVGAGNEDEDEDGENDADDSIQLDYTPPALAVDSGLTAGEVVTTVLAALNHNDVPTKNYGVQLLFAYSSPASVLNSEKAPTIDEYADFLSSSEYSVLLNHSQIIIDKADYSFDRKKSYFTVRLRKGVSGRDYTTVNFILSTKGKEEDDCWLIDSTLIRPEGIRRRGRR